MIRIVVVEDDSEDLAQLTDCLRRYEQECGDSFSIKSYANPADFLDAYRSDCDLIFMDIELPLFNGVEVARQLGGSELPMQNALLLFTLVCILTPIFYFESQVIANYDLFFYNLLNVGEIIFYVFMLMIQVLMLASAKERAEFHTMQKLWLEAQKQYRLVKENIDAINIK